MKKALFIILILAASVSLITCKDNYYSIPHSDIHNNPQGEDIPEVQPPDTGLSGSGGFPAATEDPQALPEQQDGYFIKPGKYDRIYRFSGGVAVVQIYDENKGMYTFTAIDADGNELFPPTDKYSDIGPYGFGVFKVRDVEGNEGLIDRNGNEIVQPGKYDRIYTDFWGKFSDIACVVEKEEDGIYLRGVIDNTGREIVPPGTYTVINEYSCSLAVVQGDEYNKTGAIDTSGKITVPIGEYNFYRFSDDVAVVRSLDYTSWGVIDKTGTLIVPYREGQSVTVNDFKDGAAIVTDWGAGTTGVIDKTGTYIIPMTGNYKKIQDFSDGLTVAEDTDGRYGVLDKSGGTVVPFGKYALINNYNCGVAKVFDNNNNAGFIDVSGNEIIPIGKYPHPGEFENGYMITQADGINIVIDKNGDEVFSAHNNDMDIGSVSEEGLMVVFKQNTAGVIIIPAINCRNNNAHMATPSPFA